jgi:hypothetical protein
MRYKHNWSHYHLSPVFIVKGAIEKLRAATQSKLVELQNNGDH